MTSRINLGLERIGRLLNKIGSPQNSYEIIHVAGTNGKGSVSAMIANTLTRAGFKTGLYTSPHLAHRRDCVQLNNASINQDQFRALEKVIKQESKVLTTAMKAGGTSEFEISTFEQMTAIAFKAFEQSQVDFAVVEVGLGGQYDATNIVNPVLSVITSIGIDHTDFLGKTIQSIAQAKGGIIKPNVPVVVSSDQEHGQVYGVLGHIQRQVNSGQKIRWTPPNSTLDFRISNRNTARDALQCLRDQCRSRFHERLASLSDDAIEQGLLTTQWRGRCEIVDLSVLEGSRATLVDGAHNKQSIAALHAVLEERPQRARCFILAMTAGKDVNALARMVRPDDAFFAVQFEAVDGMEWIASMPSHEIHGVLQPIVSNAKGFDYQADVVSAIRDAHRLFPTSEIIICGSLYLVGQVYRLLEVAQHEYAYCSKDSQDHTALMTYDPAKVEDKVQKYWQELPSSNPAVFKNAKREMKFLLPPPNVTGSLHIGHALTLAVQDAYCRYFRSQGHPVTWIPGVDHAGIATQSVVSKQLAKQGISTASMTRDEFVGHIWEWRDKFGAVIGNQMRRLGTSLDWNEEYFTLDEIRRDAVIEAFRRLWSAQLIKRENRMVNWSVGLQTVISDIEVSKIMIDTPTVIDGAEFGRMWRIRYEIIDDPPVVEPRYVEVDTTRPETIFGDRVLAVHPEDDRYQSLIGKKVKHPLLDHVSLEIIADDFVKPDFGTGCVKITPAHDVNDYTLSLRHTEVPIIPLFGKDGKFTSIDGYPALGGMDRLNARATVLGHLESHGALVSSQAHKTTLEMCSRSNTVIEPLLLPQWYISMDTLTQRVQVQEGIRMTESVRREWNRWLDGAQDWCISRQLVWGHQIPLYRVVDAQTKNISWVFGANKQEALQNSGGRPVEQDTDVLDTWFSSSLLPLSAFGWPTVELESDHVLEFIESGPDILFFWLIRMALMCTFLNGRPPFNEIVLHPLIRDAHGRKMSKSLGNVIDPMSLIEGQSLSSLLQTLHSGNLDKVELARATKELSQTYPDGINAFGADAVRYALIQSTVQTEALKFDIRNVEAARYLCTKLWNAVNFYKFNMAKVDGNFGAQSDQTRSESLLENWISYQLQKTNTQYVVGFEQRSLARSTNGLRFFLVDQVCDIYLEFLKVDLRQAKSDTDASRQLKLLREILERALQMFAPFMPHITEELWHAFGNKSSIHRQMAVNTSVSVQDHDNNLDNRMQTIIDLLKSLRTIPERHKAEVVVHVSNAAAELAVDLEQYSTHLRQLAGVRNLHQTNLPASSKTKPTHVSADISYTYSSPESSIKPTGPTSAQKRMQKKLDQLRELTSKSEYSERVPEGVQAKHRQEMSELEAKLRQD